VGHGILAPGDYTLGVEVINAAVSTTVPVVTGVSPVFTVVADQSVDVSVTCTPKSVTPLTESTPLEAQSFGTPWSYDVVDSIPTLVTHGGEAWYEFGPSTASTRITVTPAATSNLIAGFAVFDSLGAMVDQPTWVLTSGPVEGVYPTTAGDTYYLVIMDVGGTTASLTDRTATVGFGPAGNTTVDGTITLPADMTGKAYSVYVDSNASLSDGYLFHSSGTVAAPGTTIHYSIPSVSAGTYYVYAVIGRSEANPVDGDAIALYGAESLSTVPASPNCVVPATGTATFDLTAFPYSADQIGTGSTTVTGTITLPTSVVDKPYYVIIDTNTNGGDGYVAADAGVVTGDTINYTLQGVPAGTYFVYAVVYNAPPGNNGPQGGDYLGFYGNSTSSANVTVPATGTVPGIDVTLSTFSGGSGLAGLENAVLGGVMRALGVGFDTFQSALGSVLGVYDPNTQTFTATGPAALAISGQGISGTGTATWWDAAGSNQPFSFNFTETLNGFVIDATSGTTMSGTLNVTGTGVANVSATPVVTDSTVTVGGQDVLIKSFTYVGVSGSSGMPAYTALLNINGTDYPITYPSN
jgi:hypothetical protein